MIPPYIKFDSKASPPQWTDNGDQVIEKGTHVRVKIKGTRNEMGQLFAIATINEVSLYSSSFDLDTDQHCRISWGKIDVLTVTNMVLTL
jgi:DNA-directed RNA polymerase subunit E'/Rpb7